MLIKTSKTRSKNWRLRSQHAENFRKVHGGSGGVTDENLDKLKFLEKKLGTVQGFIPQAEIEKLME